MKTSLKTTIVGVLALIAAPALALEPINKEAYTAGVSWRVNRNSELNIGYELNPRTTLKGTGASTGTSLTSKVQMFLLGYQHTF